MKVLDQYDNAISSVGWIHALSIIHKVTLIVEGGNINITKVASNTPLPCEDKLDECTCLKTKEESFSLNGLSNSWKRCRWFSCILLVGDDIDWYCWVYGGTFYHVLLVD